MIKTRRLMTLKTPQSKEKLMSLMHLVSLIMKKMALQVSQCRLHQLVLSTKKRMIQRAKRLQLQKMRLKKNKSSLKNRPMMLKARTSDKRKRNKFKMVLFTIS